MADTNSRPSSRTVLIQVKSPDEPDSGIISQDEQLAKDSKTAENHPEGDNTLHMPQGNNPLSNGDSHHRSSISDALPDGASKTRLKPTESSWGTARASLSMNGSRPGSARSSRSTKSLWTNLRNVIRVGSAMNTTTKKKRKKKSTVEREDSFLQKFTIREREVTTTDNTDKKVPDDAAESDDEWSEGEDEEEWNFVLDPVGNLKFYWLTVVCLAIVYNFWTIIAREAWPAIHTNLKPLWLTLDYLCDFIYLLDIFVQIRTGYLEQGILVIDDRKLAMKYIKSKYFFLDAVSLTPLDFINLAMPKTHILFRFPRFLKGYRYFQWIKIAQSRASHPNILRVGNLTGLTLLLMHWFAAFYFIICELVGFGSDNWVYPVPEGQYAAIIRQYLASFYWSTLTMTMLGDVPEPENEWEYFVQIIAYLMGLFIFATIVGQVGTVIENRNASRLEFERHVDNAKKYMRAHDVPKSVQERIQRWYDYTWDLDEGDINSLGLLPDKMRTELALHVNLKTLKKVTIFNECPPEFLHDLVLKMKTIVFTPGDLVCRKGEVAREMFIISDGLLEVVGMNGNIMATLKAGDYFGEIGILNIDGVANRRTADVRSVGYSSLFTLSKDDVLLALQDYPQAERVFELEARRRMKDQQKSDTAKLGLPTTDVEYSSLSGASGTSANDQSEDPDHSVLDRRKNRVAPKTHQNPAAPLHNTQSRQSMASIIEMAMNNKSSSPSPRTESKKDVLKPLSQQQRLPRGHGGRRKARGSISLYGGGDDEGWASELACSIENTVKDKMDDYRRENKHTRRRNAELESRIRVLQEDNESKDEKISLLWKRVIELEANIRSDAGQDSQVMARKEAFCINKEENVTEESIA